MSMAPSSRPSSTWSRGSKPSAKSPRRADVLEHDEVVLAAGRRLVGGEVGHRHHAACGRPRRPRPGRPRPAFTSADSVLGAVEQRLLLVALRLRRSACPAPSARRAAARTRRSRAAPLVGRQRLVDHVRGQPALALCGAHAVGVVAEHPRIDHRVSVSAGRARASPRFRGACADHAGHLGYWTGHARRRRRTSAPPSRGPSPPADPVPSRRPLGSCSWRAVLRWSSWLRDR